SKPSDLLIGSVMVVGGGIGGIQASLDLSALGFKVYLVESSPMIGGKMAQLDKTFPTNDCSMCILSPKMIEVNRDPNVEILAYTDVDRVSGEAGNFDVLLRRKLRYVNTALCTGCGTCALYCPVKIPDPFNEGISDTKAIHVLCSQAVPAVSTIDETHCLFLTEKKCKICAPVCKKGAIDFTQTEQELALKVGAIIVTTGYEAFNASLVGEYGYGRAKNVVNSLEFERILNAAGPYQGDILRPSDGKTPGKIAWIQCVGSRNTRFHSYCSSVCCAYAIKQVILTKEHYPEIEATIFFSDIRAFGKGFEDFFKRAQEMAGVRFIRSRISTIKENKKNRNAIISYVTDKSGTQQEEFDMSVLSVGMSPQQTNKTLAEKMDFHLNSHGFCRTHALGPNETIRPGIFASGTFTGPMDIPDSIISATGAVSLASQMLSTSRSTLVEKKQLPIEKVNAEEAKIGVFVCRCGTNIGRVVDVPSVVEYASTLENVVYAEEDLFSCSSDMAKHIEEMIREKGLNRVVVAACTPRTHEPLFQETLREAGINKNLFEMANIREHCSWVHSREKEKATGKAKDILAMSVARASNLAPLQEIELPVNKRGLVLGGGLAGMQAALGLARQGFKVYLVERESDLGGNLNHIKYTLEGIKVRPFLERMIKEVESQGNIKVFKGYELKSFSGFVGNFKSRLEGVGQGDDEKSQNSLIDLEYGALIVATGGKELKPSEYLYGETKRVVTQQELENMLVSGNSIQDLNQVVIIQCVGARNETRPYCSRICCGEAVKNALRLRELNANVEIFIFYRDMRTYGFKEDYYALARERGIKFIRYEPGNKPAIELKGERVSVNYHDLVLNMEGEINPDLVVLSTPVVPEGNVALSQLLKIPLTNDGFLMEAHLKLRPIDLATEGIFLCGLTHYPKYISETISQANGAAARAATVLSRDKIVASGIVGEVNELECISCGLCQKVCPYGAVELQEKPQGTAADIISALCKGCGACTSVCPTHAITLHHFTDTQIFSQIEAAYSVSPKSEHFEPKILAFLCNWCGYAGADLAGVSRMQYASNVRVVRVMCAARVHSKFIAAALLRGIDGVMVVGCHAADCHYISGIHQAMKTVQARKKTLEKWGIDPERLQLAHISAGEGAKFAETINHFTAAVTHLGPLELTADQITKMSELKVKKISKTVGRGK
ncbi:MAG: hydrogenase iron-sulfur subunit, partial [Candidatus Tectomicrobia bacterium]|nr:hydrogenase iron-sulfur subunit [Candidatus Tectomicrobia bacterium]